MLRKPVTPQMKVLIASDPEGNRFFEIDTTRIGLETFNESASSDDDLFLSNGVYNTVIIYPTDIKFVE